MIISQKKEIARLLLRAASKHLTKGSIAFCLSLAPEKQAKISFQCLHRNLRDLSTVNKSPKILNEYSTFWGCFKLLRFWGLCQASALRHLDFDFKHFKAILSFETDLDVFGVDFDILRNDRDQLTL